MQPLLSWYDAGHRDLPWRSEPAPLSRLGERDHAAADARGGRARLFFPLDERAARIFPLSRRRTRPFTPSSGRGSATTAACATCTVQRSCCARNTAASCLPITTDCLLCPASASTRQARWRLSRSDCPFRRWTATFCVWRRGWITISRRSRTQNSKSRRANGSPHSCRPTVPATSTSR